MGETLLKGITEKHGKYMEQYDMTESNEVMQILEKNQEQKQYNHFERPINWEEVYRHKKNIEDAIFKAEEKKANDIFEKNFGKPNTQEDLDLMQVLETLIKRKNLLEEEYLLNGELTKQEKEELKTLKSLKILER